MSKSLRLTACLAGAALMLTATGCHYNHGYYSVGYDYSYDCSPRYYSSWGLDFSSGYYKAPCDGIRYRAGYSYGGRGFGKHFRGRCHY